ncbi:uncharacterized protein N7479_009139 [Penicillium vulpinum]|uniref:uncharacterized protein n=1 Tax=Penicillium vulpinum TaxID=29845 RepID=UPI002547C1B1|nr:uncharacterized protein N7479_009139 [Penicillium vulpinum]KAJ5950726.1 hypothetical protein N7479_009139 [Penicillium vulpinum]
MYATALGGACDRSVYRTANNLPLSAPLVSYNSPIRMTSETLGKVGPSMCPTGPQRQPVRVLLIFLAVRRCGKWKVRNFTYYTAHTLATEKPQPPVFEWRENGQGCAQAPGYSSIGLITAELDNR